MPYVPAKQPESTSRILSRSLELYRRTFFHVFPLALILAIIAFIPRLITLMSGQDLLTTLPNLSLHKIWLFLLDVVCLIIMLAILWCMQSLTSGTKETFKIDFQVALKKFPLIIVAAIIQSLIFMSIMLVTYGFYIILLQYHLLFQTNIYAVFLLSLPMTIAWILYLYAFYLFYFYLPLILTENAGIISSLVRSAKLVWGNWWRTFRAQVTPWISYLIVLILVKYIGHVNLHIYFIKVNTLSLSATALHIFIFALFLPWFASTLLVQLRDLELRKKPKPAKKVAAKKPTP